MPKRVRNQRVIDKLLDLGTINDEQHCALERFWLDYYKANYYKLVKCKGFVSAGSNTAYYSELCDVISARQRYERARSQLSTRERGVVEWTSVKDEFLKYSRYKNNLPTAHKILRQGADKLARFYGYLT